MFNKGTLKKGMKRKFKGQKQVKKETILKLNYPEQFEFYSKVEDDKRFDTASEIMSELEFRLSSFFTKHFDHMNGIKTKFKVDHLLSLPAWERRKFEILIQEIIGHSVCWDFFSGWNGQRDVH